jgi:hypothetical protein
MINCLVQAKCILNNGDNSHVQCVWAGHSRTACALHIAHCTLCSLGTGKVASRPGIRLNAVHCDPSPARELTGRLTARVMQWVQCSDTVDAVQCRECSGCSAVTRPRDWLLSLPRNQSPASCPESPEFPWLSGWDLRLGPLGWDPPRVDTSRENVAFLDIWPR